MMTWLHSLTGPEFLAVVLLSAIAIMALARVSLAALVVIYYALSDDEDP